MVQGYRKKVGMKTGGITLYDELKTSFIKQDIKIGRDKFYDFLRLHNLLVPMLKNYVTTTNSKWTQLSSNCNRCLFKANYGL
jgi:putative transposase